MNARQDPDVPEGVVFVPFCYTEAAANVLTSSRLDPAAKIPEFKFSAAKISLTE
jgi:formate dehydrogenase major subunit